MVTLGLKKYLNVNAKPFINSNKVNDLIYLVIKDIS